MRTVFLFNIQSISDVITNSSSELFVINDTDEEKRKEQIIELLDTIYPDWRREYEEPVKFDEIYNDELDYIIDFSYEPDDDLSDFIHSNYKDNEQLGVSKFNEKFQKEKYRTPQAKTALYYGLCPDDFWDGFKTWKASIEFGYSHIPFLSISEKGKQAIIDKHKNAWLLRSKYENPDWDWQEKLSNIAKKYHLG